MELEFEKDVDDIETPVLLAEGWKKLEILVEPTLEKNNALKEQEKSEVMNPDAGFNFSCRLAIVSDDPMFNGRMFFLRLPFPNSQDEKEYTSRGVKKYDEKMERIVKFVEAFGGTISGRRAVVNKGAQGRAYLLQQINKLTGEVENQIDIFNRDGFKKAEEV